MNDEQNKNTELKDTNAYHPERGVCEKCKHKWYIPYEPAGMSRDQLEGICCPQCGDSRPLFGSLIIRRADGRRSVFTMANVFRRKDRTSTSSA